MMATSPYDYLAATALTQPEALALVTPTSTFTFAELRDVTRNIGGVLREQGIRAGDIVATQLPADIDWLLTLALIHEGAVTCSVGDASQAAAVGASLLIAEASVGNQVAGPTPTLVIDHAWVRRASEVENAYAPVAYAEDDAMVRLVLTSGTTGTPKIARYNLGPIVRRNDNLDKFWIPGVHLNMMGMTTMGAFYQGMAHLAVATPYIILSAVDARAAQLVADFGVTIIIGSPLNLGQLCEVVRASAIKVPTVMAVIVVGSTPSDRIVEAIREQFGVDARLSYGSTEGGAVTTRVVLPGDDPRNVGHPYPGVTLEIVDEHDAFVAPGETGFVRYKTLDMIDGYFRDPAATAAAFRDGWFYPGDLGFFLTDGQLTVVGRTEDVLNLGGVKIDPLSIDRAVMAFPGVVDAAAFITERHSVVPRLAVAVVGDPGLDLPALDAHMRREYPALYPSVYVLTEAIPRNAAGKIRRAALEDLLTAADLG
jgi:acyl-coenzyme A synthetase/AMP-(fatty) acid ligase